MNSPNTNATAPQRRPADFLPNEQEISYDRIQLFFEKYKYGIIASVILLVAGVCGLVGYRIQQDKKEELANERFAAAHTPDEWKAVAATFPGSNAAVLSEFAIASQAFDAGNWDAATAAYQEILEHYVTSPFIPSAFIGKASVLEAMGKRQDALKVYESVVGLYPKTFEAPHAQFAAARIYETGGQLKEARKAYEDLIANYSQSAWKDQAEERLKKLSFLIKDQPVAAAAESQKTPTTVPTISILPSSSQNKNK
jgi:tetratricopeptide (TPR) repeat protein